MAADKEVMNIVATGSVNLKPKCWPENPIAVNNVKYIPSVSHNLLSVSQIVRRGHEVKFTNRGLFVFQGHEDRKALSLASPPENLDVWHRRMGHFNGHLNVNSLNKLKNDLSTGVHFK